MEAPLFDTTAPHRAGSLAPWGRYVEVPSLTTSQANAFASKYAKSQGTRWAGMEVDHIAAGLGGDNADSCTGDSGGPLLNVSCPPPFWNEPAPILN